MWSNQLIKEMRNRALFQPPRIPLYAVDDYVQHVCLQVHRTYDPERGASLRTYAWQMIDWLKSDFLKWQLAKHNVLLDVDIHEDFMQAKLSYMPKQFEQTIINTVIADPQYKELALFHGAGYTHEEIAEQENVSRETIRHRIQNQVRVLNGRPKLRHTGFKRAAANRGI